MFRIVIVLIAILFLLVSPFLFARLYNNYVLWRFASQTTCRLACVARKPRGSADRSNGKETLLSTTG